jgi:hypothetical protein
VNVFSNINFKAVQWGPTLALHLLRAFSAGIVWAIVVLLANGGSSGGPTWWTLPLLLPSAYLFSLPIYLLAVKIFSAFMGDGIGQLSVAVVTLLFALGIAVGDPLVYILHKTKPAFVPTEKFNFVNFALVLFVLDPAKAAAAA